MTKIHDIKTIVADGMVIKYFYKRERNDYYGNPRYRVYIIELENRAITETIAETYNLDEWVCSFLKNAA